MTTKGVSFIVIIANSSDSSVSRVHIIREPAVSAAPFGRSKRSWILVVAKIKVESLGVRLDTATSENVAHKPTGPAEGLRDDVSSSTMLLRYYYETHWPILVGNDAGRLSL